MGLGQRWASANFNGTRAVATTLGLAVATGLATAASLIWMFGWAPSAQVATISALYALGAGTGFGIALVLTALIAPKASRRRKIALTLVLAVFGSLAVTMALLVLEHRIYYSQWHGPVLSRVWLWQQFFTALGAVAQYGVMGIRYHGIAAPIVLIAASWWAHRPSH